MYNNDIKWIVKSIDGIMYKNGYSSIVIDRVLKNTQLDKQSQNTHRKIVYGVVENWLYLDYLLSNFVKKRIKNDLKCFLMAGLYELFFLDGRANHAVLNRYVDTAKVDYQHAHKFVNAILRRALREPIDLTQLDKQTYLSIRYSQPKWLVARWLKQFGEAVTKEMLHSNLENRGITLRINAKIATRKSVLESLKNEGVVAIASEYFDNAIAVKSFSGASLEALTCFKAGWFTVQDVGAMLVGKVSGAKGDMCVLDLCSAPGGKATDLAERLDDGKVVACDIHPHKLELINQTARRLKLNNIHTEISDAKFLREDFLEAFDIVLLDVPCSGFGVISKKPEIKYRKNLKDIERLIKIQRQMLDIAHRYVKIGGNLIYSTCTVDLEENENQIKAFLQRHKNYEKASLNAYGLEDDIFNEDFISIKPSKAWTDGFFIAKLKRLK